MLVMDTHCHTYASGHAFSTLKETVEAAACCGLSLVAITDHGPAMQGASDRTYFWNLKSIPKEIEGVEVLGGVELNILDEKGRLDLEDALLKRLPVVIASLHSVCIKPGGMSENTSAVVSAMQNPFVNIIGHLGDPLFPVDMAAVVRAAKQTYTALEVNDASLREKSPRPGSEKHILEMLEMCRQEGVYVTAGSDSHIYLDVGRMDCAQAAIEKAGLSDRFVLNTDVDLFKNFIAAKRQEAGA